MTSDPPPFDVCAELPAGTTVLEASAGTGKTYTIAALTARAIAEGAAELNQLLLVTFGRMATNELRLRVRERLVSVESCLADAIGRARSHRPAQPARSHAHDRSARRAEHVDASGCRGRSPSSTPPPLPPPTSSAFRCSTGSAYLAIESRTPPSWSTSPISPAK